MNPNKVITRFNNKILLPMIIPLFILYFYNIWDKKIFMGTEELFIQDISYSMIQSGNFIVPMVNGQPYFLKPPVLYWITAPLYLFLPPALWMVRLWMPIIGVLLVIFVYKIARLWYGKITAFYSALFLATSIPIIFYTKMANYDLLNTLFTTLTIYYYNLSKKKSILLLLTAVFCSLGILTRSILALTPIGVIVIDHLLQFRKESFKRLFIFLLLVFIIILPWHLLAYLKNPQFFLIDYLLVPFQLHFVGNIPGNTINSPLFYLSIFILFPPIIFLLCYKYFYSLKTNLFAFIQLSVWVIGLLAVLSISGERHEWYILGIYPALAIGTGCIVKEIFNKTKPQSFVHFFTAYTVLIFTLAPLLLLFTYNIPQPEVITATNIMKEQSNLNDILYIWHYPLVWETHFYPHRKIIILSDKILSEAIQNKKVKFLLIEKNDLPSNLKLPNHKILYQTKEIVLIQFFPNI